jgi:hypothetical protein
VSWIDDLKEKVYTNGILFAEDYRTLIDNVSEKYLAKEDFPTEGDTTKLYIAIDEKKIYCWAESAYEELSAPVSNLLFYYKTDFPTTGDPSKIYLAVDENYRQYVWSAASSAYAPIEKSGYKVVSKADYVSAAENNTLDYNTTYYVLSDLGADYYGALIFVDENGEGHLQNHIISAYLDADNVKFIVNGDVSHLACLSKLSAPTTNNFGGASVSIDENSSGTRLLKSTLTTFSGSTNYYDVLSNGVHRADPLYFKVGSLLSVPDDRNFMRASEAVQQFATVFNDVKTVKTTDLKPLMDAALTETANTLIEETFEKGMTYSSPAQPKIGNTVNLAANDFTVVIPVYPLAADLSNSDSYKELSTSTIKNYGSSGSPKYLKSDFAANFVCKTSATKTYPAVGDLYADLSGTGTPQIWRITEVDDGPSGSYTATNGTEASAPYSFTFPAEIPVGSRITVSDLTNTAPATARTKLVITSFSDSTVTYTGTTNFTYVTSFNFTVTTAIPANTPLRIYSTDANILAKDSATKVCTCIFGFLYADSSGTLDNAVGKIVIIADAGSVNTSYGIGLRDNSLGAGGNGISVQSFSFSNATKEITKVNSDAQAYDAFDYFGKLLKIKHVLTMPGSANVYVGDGEYTLNDGTSDVMLEINLTQTELETTFEAGTFQRLAGVTYFLTNSSGAVVKAVQMLKETAAGTAPVEGTDYVALWPQSTDFTAIAGYDSTVDQTLQHGANGGVKWVNNA